MHGSHSPCKNMREVKEVVIYNVFAVRFDYMTVDKEEMRHLFNTLFQQMLACNESKRD